jgi:hypothetical protein
MKHLWREHGLLIVAFGLFFLFWAGQAVAGYFTFNDEQRDFGAPAISFLAYFFTGHFSEATTENWESEFLQMGLFVLLTAALMEKGAAESEAEDTREEERQEEAQAEHPKGRSKAGEESPWPVRKGGPVMRWLFERSLSIALLAVFGLCFLLHAISGTAEYNHEQLLMAKPPVSVGQFLRTPEFWFQSFQNWQSEFLAVASLTVFSIFLRQKGSSESKRVAQSAHETGTE